MNNNDYTIKELVSDQSFRRLVKGTASHQEIEKWNEWMEDSEANRKKAKKAIAKITGFEFADPQLPNINNEWEKLYRKTAGKSRFQTSSHRSRKGSTSKWMYRIAAVLVMGVMLGLGFYIYFPNSQSEVHLEQVTEERTITTGENKQKTVQFSNGSKIVLNSNSEITYSLPADQQTIEVFIKGEAFFEAESSPESTEPVFAVNTPDGVITDIGTKFMVTVQQDRSRVVLEEGEVQISTGNQEDKTNIISMVAGELLEFDQSQVLKKENVNSSFYTSWVTGYMEFGQTSIEEFSAFVEQRFEVKVHIVNEELADIKIDGGIYYQSLEELVRSVSEVADLPVYQTQGRDTVIIGNQK